MGSRSSPGVSRGLTLVELVIVLAAVGILVSVLAPVVMAVGSQAAYVRAERDEAAIRDAMLRLLSDTGVVKIRTAGQAGLPVQLLVSDGDIPALNGGDAGWTRPLADTGVVDRLDHHLLVNQPAGRPEHAWARPRLPYSPGWRGAYLTGPAGSDPWGSRYAVNVGFLGTRDDVVVLSAGPNRAVDSPFQQRALAPLHDDLALLVR